MRSLNFKSPNNDMSNLDFMKISQFKIFYNDIFQLFPSFNSQKISTYNFSLLKTPNSEFNPSELHLETPYE